jgi:hypothetical protein
MLQFYLVRAQFNPTAGAVYKENTRIEWESNIYMDRYVDDDENDFSAWRDDYWKWKVELEQAQKTKAELLKKVQCPDMVLIVEGRIAVESAGDIIHGTKFLGTRVEWEHSARIARRSGFVRK